MLSEIVGNGIGSLLDILVTIVIGVLIIGSTVYITDQYHARVVQRLGKFLKVSNAGLGLRIPIIDGISAPISLKIQQHNVEVETITSDKVSVKLRVSVQYHVLNDKVYEAYYKLQNPSGQLSSYVFDVVRSEVPKLVLDNVFSQKEQIAIAIKESLTSTMDDFGYGIDNVLVTDIDPDARVKAAMNAINEAERTKTANEFKGEADKILKVKEAEADKQRKILQGEGIAGQRAAIINGLKASIEDFRSAVPGATSKDVMKLVMMTLHYDTLGELGKKAGTRLLMLPYNPGTVSKTEDEILASLLVSEETPKSDSTNLNDNDQKA